MPYDDPRSHGIMQAYTPTAYGGMGMTGWGGGGGGPMPALPPDQGGPWGPGPGPGPWGPNTPFQQAMPPAGEDPWNPGQPQGGGNFPNPQPWQPPNQQGFGYQVPQPPPPDPHPWAPGGLAQGPQKPDVQGVPPKVGMAPEGKWSGTQYRGRGGGWNNAVGSNFFQAGT